MVEKKLAANLAEVEDEDKNLKETYGCDVKDADDDFTVVDDIHRDNR